MTTPEETGAGDAPALSPEQLADLRRLQLGAAKPNEELQQLEQAEEAQATAEEDSLVATNAASLSLIFDLAAPTFDQFGFPNVARVLSAPATQRSAAGEDVETGLTNGQTLATVWAPVLARHGVNLGGFGDKYRLEIVAVMVTAPIAKALYVAVQIDTGGKKQVPKAVASTDGGAAIGALGTRQPGESGEVKLG